MTKQEITNKVHELRELMRMQEELAAEIEAAKDQIKAEMTDQNLYEFHGTDYKVTWNEVTQSRIDTYKAAADLCGRLRPILERFDGKVYNCKLDKALKDLGRVYAEKHDNYVRIYAYFVSGYNGITLAQCTLDESGSTQER